MSNDTRELMNVNNVEVKLDLTDFESAQDFYKALESVSEIKSSEHIEYDMTLLKQMLREGYPNKDIENEIHPEKHPDHGRFKLENGIVVETHMHPEELRLVGSHENMINNINRKDKDDFTEDLEREIGYVSAISIKGGSKEERIELVKSIYKKSLSFKGVKYGFKNSEEAQQAVEEIKD